MTKRSIATYIFMVSLSMTTLSLFHCDMETRGVDFLDEREGGDKDEDLEAVELEGTEGSHTFAMRELMHAGIDLLEEGTITSYMDLTSYWVVTFDENNNMSRQLCRFQFGPVLGTQVILDDAVAPKMIADDMQWDVDGKTYTAGDYTWTWGVHLTDPRNDALPDSPDDTRLWDQDEDGNPAVTVAVIAVKDNFHMGRRYMVRRSIVTSYTGAVSDDGVWIEGTFNFLLDDYVVGLEEGSSLMIGSVPITLQDPDVESPFVLRRLPEGSTCALVLENGDNLFVKGSEIIDGDDDTIDAVEEDSDVADSAEEEIVQETEPELEPVTEVEPEALEEDAAESQEDDSTAETEAEPEMEMEIETVTESEPDTAVEEEIQAETPEEVTGEETL